MKYEKQVDVRVFSDEPQLEVWRCTNNIGKAKLHRFKNFFGPIKTLSIATSYEPCDDDDDVHQDLGMPCFSNQSGIWNLS